MSIATHTARTVTRSVATGKSKEKTPGSLVFLLALWFSLFFGIMVLVALIIDTAIAGAPRFDMNLLTNYSSIVRPETSGFRAGILGSLWLMLFTAIMAVPLGIAAALYLEEFADSTTRWNRFVEVNLQNLAAVPAIVYGLLAVAVMALIGFQESGIVLGGALGPGAADPPRHHHHDPRGRTRGAAGDPSGLARARRHRVADDVAPDPAVRHPGHRHRHHPRSVARHRRGGAPGGRRAWPDPCSSTPRAS